MGAGVGVAPQGGAYIECRLSTLLDGGQALVVDVGLQKLLQLSQAVRDPRHQVVHPPQI